jgi:hypothetical protein
MGEACSKHEKEQKCIYRFGKPEGDLEDMGIYGRIILKKIILKKEGCRV